MAEEQFTQLEIRLKNILQITLEVLKQKLKTKAQMTELQDLLIDYQNNEELAEIIQNVVKMDQKITSKLISTDQSKNMIEQQQYQKLEQSVQALQAKQRYYIKSQNQLKLYCEELQNKVKDLQISKNQLVVSTKKVILDLKRDNQSLIEKIRLLSTKKQSSSNGQKSIENQLNSVRVFRKQGQQSIQKLPKAVKNNEKAENSLRSKLQQYQEVIQSIEASRGRKHSAYEPKDRVKNQVK